MKPQIKLHRRRAVVGNRWSRLGTFVSAIAVASGVFIAWSAYDLGQSRAGHNRQEAEQRYVALEREFDVAQAERLRLREKVALLETNVKIDTEAYRRVGDQVESLQVEILAQQEDLAFYRGILADQTGLRIQDMELSAGVDASSFSVNLVLAQAIRADRRISGHIALEIEGDLDGESRTFDLKALQSSGALKNGRLAFSFRYFQNLKTNLVLPVGFSPERVRVTLMPAGKSAKPVERSFEWKALAS
jgi:hypothetical protein